MSEPVSQPLSKALAAGDDCPRCLVGELDTGWECNHCGYDARPLVMPVREPSADTPPSS
jgi:hypothetical protein